MTNTQFWKIIDRLETNARTKSKTECSKEETFLGIKYNPDGIWYNRHLRLNVLRPTENYIRDPMHTCVSQGVCNTEMYHMIIELQKHKPLKELQTFSDEFNFPSSLPKAKSWWLSEDRLNHTSRSVTLFANEVLGAMQIMMGFLLEHMGSLSAMADNIKCFQLLFCIVQLIMTGCETAMRFKTKLLSMIETHHNLSFQLYGISNVKPKWHHMIHLCDYRKLLSCFVTERKHKETRGACLWVFRNVEKACTTRVINAQTENLIEADELFNHTALVDPNNSAAKGPVHSKSIRLRCGTVKSGDIVWVNGVGAGMAKLFWQQGNEFAAAISMFLRAGDDRCWNPHACTIMFFNTDRIVSAVAWYPSCDGCIKVVVPILARMKI